MDLYLINYIRFGLRDQGIILSSGDITLTFNINHMIFLAHHVGESNPLQLADYLTGVWAGRIFLDNQDKYILKTDNMEIDSRPTETEINIIYVKS